MNDLFENQITQTKKFENKSEDNQIIENVLPDNKMNVKKIQ